MEKDDFKTVVIFRFVPAWNSVIALFPEDVADSDYECCSSYMTVGQHAAADYYGIIEISRPARSAEYLTMARELENNYGYDLDIRQRASQKMHERRYEEIRRLLRMEAG